MSVRNSSHSSVRRPLHVGIDFGTTNTDAVLYTDSLQSCWTLPNIPLPDEGSIHAILNAHGVQAHDVKHIAVTGGNRNKIPLAVEGIPVSQAGEIDAIGRGGVALAQVHEQASEARLEAVIVSAGSGTAVVRAHNHHYSHVTGTGIGGGTLIGLGRLLLHTADPKAIDALALRGNPNAVNLTIGDVIGGALGRLPEDATAVNFGRMARYGGDATPEDIAAALVELVAQVIAVVGINAARAQNLDHIIVTGHLSDMQSIRAIFKRIAEFSGVSIAVPEHGGYAVALGALLSTANAA